MASIFSRIVAGEIPCYKVAEDDNYYAFLDINPLAKGHTLVIPKREVDYFFDLTDEEIGAMQIFAKKVAEGIKRAFPCIKVGQAVLLCLQRCVQLRIVEKGTASQVVCLCVQAL